MDHFSPSSLHDKEDLKGRKKKLNWTIFWKTALKKYRICCNRSWLWGFKKIDPFDFFREKPFSQVFFASCLF